MRSWVQVGSAGIQKDADSGRRGEGVSLHVIDVQNEVGVPPCPSDFPVRLVPAAVDPPEHASELGHVTHVAWSPRFASTLGP